MGSSVVLSCIEQQMERYLPADWTKSDGANVESDFARATGKQIFWENKEDALVFGDDDKNYNVWLPIE